MSNDRHPSEHGRNNYHPHRRKPARRTTDRETVQSDELSSTNGARLISNDSSRDPYRSSATSSQIKISGTPHPKSPAAQALRARNDDPLPADAYERILSGISYGEPAADRSSAFAAIPDPTKPETTASNPAVMASDASRTNSFSSQTVRAQATHAGRTGEHARVDAGSGSIPPNHTTATGSIPVPVQPQHTRTKKRVWPRIVIAAAIIVAAVFGANFAIEQVLYNQPVKVTVNGEEMTLEGSERTIEGLLDNGIVNATPGNYVAVDESIIREGDGTRCTAIINEQAVDDLNTHINEGDQVVVSNGTNVMEAYTDSDPTVIPASFTREGSYGALHIFLPGQDGETVTRTGSESGLSVEMTTKEKLDDRLVYYNANTNGEKVIALTFDDGPWDTTTDQILDILKENGAKATFYTIGDQISSHTNQINRMTSEGHEIATHTWDHASGSGNGVSLDLMSVDERKQEVEKGLAAIEEVTGKPASSFFRAPGGNFNFDTATALEGLVDGEIGWNIDTEDWRRPGAEVIAARISSAQPGEIILMHDGGGDRSQTVEGLRAGLASLKQQGYKFVTISELVEAYPPEG